MAEGKKIKITQTGSHIGRTEDQRATLIGLGLNKRHRSRELVDTPEVREIGRQLVLGCGGRAARAIENPAERLAIGSRTPLREHLLGRHGGDLLRRFALAMHGVSRDDRARQIERLAGVVQPAASKPERSDEDKLAALRRVWSESRPIQRGDEAEQYLLGRGLHLHDLPESVRVHQALRYHDGETVGTYAAMIATVTGPDGKARSLHRTYLQDARKAPVAAPKKLMQGLPLLGTAIRLTATSQVLGIAEGVETALAASELFEVPCWSCISTAGIESFEPPAGVREVIVFADNDANFAGQKAAYAAAHRLRLKGLGVEVVTPPAVGDWLDELNRRKQMETQGAKIP